jgi:hypothetical protein
MPKVFVVNEPLKRIPGSSAYGRAIDLRPAEVFGELVYLAPAGEPPLDPFGWWPEMAKKLLDFNPAEDFLLPVGHPALITAAASIIGAYCGTTQKYCINILVWRGRELGYVACQIPLLPNPEPQGESHAQEA